MYFSINVSERNLSPNTIDDRIELSSSLAES